MKVARKDAVDIEAIQCNTLVAFIHVSEWCPLIHGIKHLEHDPQALVPAHIEFITEWEDHIVRAELGDYVLWTKEDVWTECYSDFHKKYVEVQ